MLYKFICGARVSALRKKSEKFSLIRCYSPCGGIQMRVSDRWGGPISHDALDAGDSFCAGPADYLTAEKIFEPRRALSLLEQAMTRLRQEYLARGKGLVFDIFRAFVGITRIFHFFPQR
jgi:hypothetical protein